MYEVNDSSPSCNVVYDKYQMDMKNIKAGLGIEDEAAADKKCTCDWTTVVLRYGCQCGRYK